MSSLLVLTEIESALAGLQASAMELEGRRRLARRIDGRIIGNGQADFTQANTLYRLQLARMPLQILDVPGIEGNEAVYAHLVEAAVAKAHLVVYVNGTNKKPEARTAERIRHYLRRTTKVLPVVNVRGHADAYEFEEDRLSLQTQAEPATALRQTTGVLRDMLGAENVLDGHCIQGLIAFSSLALDPGHGDTSICAEREIDLVRPQKRYLDTFTSPEAMRAFSQIEQLSSALTRRASNFECDIVEANKGQVVALLAETCRSLHALRQKHQAFMADITPHFADCQVDIDGIALRFEEAMHRKRTELCRSFFRKLTESADKAVASSFGDQVAIEAAIGREQRRHADDQAKAWEEWNAEQSRRVNDDLQRATKRLVQDVARREVRLTLALRFGVGSDGFSPTELQMGLSLEDWFDMAKSCASYVEAGFRVGSAWPGPGNLIGAGLGAIVGIVKVFFDFSSGKAERIRNAQKQLHGGIDSLCKAQLSTLDEERKAFGSQLESELDRHLRRPLRTLLENLAEPSAILDNRANSLEHLKAQLERMPHGSILEIQR